MNQIRLLATKYAESFDFYEATLGLDLAFGDRDSGYAEFLTGNDTSAIALMDKQLLSEVVGDERSAEPTDAFNLTFTVDSVDSAYDALKAKGVNFITPPTTRAEMGGRTAHFRDPEGNLIELYEMLDAAS